MATPLHWHLIVPHALNNLAWLYATSKDEFYRDHETALNLAQQAAAIERSASHSGYAIGMFVCQRTY